MRTMDCSDASQICRDAVVRRHGSRHGLSDYSPVFVYELRDSPWRAITQNAAARFAFSGEVDRYVLRVLREFLMRCLFDLRV